MDTFIHVGLSFLIGVILPVIFVKFLPNEKFYKWGEKAGQKLSSKGFEFFGKNWENLENKLTGSFLAFA